MQGILLSIILAITLVGCGGGGGGGLSSGGSGSDDNDNDIAYIGVKPDISVLTVRYTNSLSPELVILSNTLATITDSGKCGLNKSTITLGTNLVSILSYNDAAIDEDVTIECDLEFSVSRQATDGTGSIDVVTDVSVEAFSVDVTPLLTNLDIADTITTDRKISLQFTTNIAGTVTIEGSCNNTILAATEGDNTISITGLNNTNLAFGTYNDCTLRLLAADDEVATAIIPTFQIIDDVSITNVLLVNSQGDNTPTLQFEASTNANITFSGNCSSTTTASVVGSNSITLLNSDNAPFANGTVNDCALTFTSANDLVTVAKISVPSFDIFVQTLPIISNVSITSTALGIATLEFMSNSVGHLSYSGNCTSTTTAATASLQQISLIAANGQAYPDGTYTDCMVSLIASNDSEVSFNVPSFTVDIKPLLTNLYIANTVTTDRKISLQFTTNVAGTVTIQGVCNNKVLAVPKGDNTISITGLNNTDLAFGTYSDCALRLLAADDEVATAIIPTFQIIDTVSITEVKLISNGNTPTLQFEASTNANITFSGNCSSATTASVVGSNSITLLNSDDQAFANGTVNDCALTFTSANDLVTVTKITVPSFEILVVTLPQISNISVVSTTLGVALLKFESNLAGTLSFSGNCTSSTSAATAALQELNLIAANGESYPNGTYTDCVVTLIDSNDNEASFNVPSFTVSDNAASLTILSIDTDIKPLRPTANIQTSHAGTITTGGDCSTVTTSVSKGDSSVELSSSDGGGNFSAGTYTGCILKLSTTNYGDSIKTAPSFTIVVPTACEYNSMDLEELYEDTDQCEAHQDALEAYPFSYRIGGFAQLAQEAISANGAINSTNSRLSIVDTFHSKCTTAKVIAAGNDGTSDGCSAFHGDNIIAVTETFYGVSPQNVCAINDDDTEPTIDYTADFIPTVYACATLAPERSILSLSLTSVLLDDQAAALGGGTCKPVTGFDTCYFNREFLLDHQLFAFIATGNDPSQTQPLASTFGYATDITSMETLVDYDASDDDRERAGLFVTGDYMRITSSASNEYVVNVVGNGDAVATGCGKFWKSCVATSYYYPIWDNDDYTNVSAAEGVGGTSFATPSAASAFAMLLHRWPTLWDEDDDNPNEAVELYLACTTYDGAPSSWTTAQKRHRLGSGFVDFTCLFQPNGTMYSAPPTNVDNASDNVADISSDISSVKPAAGNIVPAFAGALVLPASATVDALIGYDSYGRDFDLTPPTYTAAPCSTFHGEFDNFTVAWCDDTVRSLWHLNAKVKVGGFFSNNSFNGAFGLGDLAMGDSIGLVLAYENRLNLTPHLAFTLDARFNAGTMLQPAHNSYLQSYNSASAEVDAALAYKGLHISYSRSTGAIGSLQIAANNLALTPQSNDWWSMQYRYHY